MSLRLNLKDALSTLNRIIAYPTGRFIVRLPLKADTLKLSENEIIAIRTQKKIERNLSCQMKRDYNLFMQKYISLAHVRKIDRKDLNHSSSGNSNV